MRHGLVVCLSIVNINVILLTSVHHRDCSHRSSINQQFPKTIAQKNAFLSTYYLSRFDRIGNVCVSRSVLTVHVRRTIATPRALMTNEKPTDESTTTGRHFAIVNHIYFCRFQKTSAAAAFTVSIIHSFIHLFIGPTRHCSKSTINQDPCA
jgi:hypothetical protein